MPNSLAFDKRAFAACVSCAIALFSGCNRAPEPGRAQPETTPPASATAVPVTPPFTRHPGGPRVVAIGDLHGDFYATRAALRLAGAIDGSDRWSGGKLVVVQTGDQLDRGDGEREIVDLFERLSREAASAGGAVIALNGNHETMNVQGDFRYVTPAGFHAFGAVTPASPHARGTGDVERERAGAFLPGGGYARKLVERDIVAIVNDTVYAHGGVLPEHVAYGIDRMNREVRAWMAGKGRVDPELIAGERAPVWTRVYGEGRPLDAVCGDLERVLSALGAKRMVIGHTIQKGGISAACGDKVYRIDVGMARYYGNNPIQVLEITGAGVKILTGAREELLAAPAPSGKQKEKVKETALTP
jgi:hypothetical protein